jgi:2-amino-4-hydroxy-6-hydroxymethyldihydropteridine diphosphokinase
MTRQAYISLGSNIGNRPHWLRFARNEIRKNLGSIISESSIYRTEPWQMENAGWFANQVIQVETSFDSKDILELTQNIEQDSGRKRKENDQGEYASRTLDIDLLYLDNLIIDSGNITIPHPRLHVRQFTLIPLVEISANFMHPILGMTNQELLEICEDSTSVKLLE